MRRQKPLIVRMAALVLLGNLFLAAADVPALAEVMRVTGKAPFDDAGSVKEWSFSNGPEFPGATGGLEWSNTEGHGKPGCLALNHNFAAGGNYVAATWNLPAPVESRGMSLSIRKPAGHGLTIRATDSTGQTHQKTTHFAHRGWQQIEVNLTRFTSHWGGADDGIVHLPIKAVGILVENSAEPRAGTVWIDDIGFGEPALASSGVLQSTYAAAEFNEAGGRREYTFDDKRGRAPLFGGITLLGEPDAMRLVLDSDGSGHAVHAEFASHFQTFFKQIGTLGPAGRQTIDVPLGELKDWQHAGMENDGQVRYPLRLTRIWLERRADGPKTGTIRLHRLEADIHFAARNAVQLRPDIREEGETVTFSLEMQNLRARAVKGQLVCEYHSLTGRLDAKSLDVEVPGQARNVRHEFSFPLGRHHMVEAVFRWLDPELSIAPVSIGLSTPPADPGSTRLDPASPMGCGLYLYRWQGNPAARENMERIAALAQRAGVKWTREEFQWSATEPRPGEFRFDFYDQVVDIAHAHGISVYGLLCYWAPWAKANTQEGIDQYCNWVRQVVRRYKDRIHHWEIWNEPNIFFWSGPKELYAALLTQAYAAVKAEDPTAAVLGCSTAGIDTKFIEMVMAKGGKFDDLTIHPYRGRMEDLPFIEELRDARKLVGGRDVWLTEIGFPSQLVTGWSERRQASLAARTYLASVASGAMRNVSWYDFRNDGPDPYENEQNFGLVRHDFRLKPGYRAMAAVCRALAGKPVKEQVEVGDGAYAFRFGDGKQDVIAACAPEHGRLLSFETAADVTVIDAFEQPVQPHRAQSRLTVTLDAGFPLFIAGPTGFAFKPAPLPVTTGPASLSARPGEKIGFPIHPGSHPVSFDLPFGWPEPEDIGSGGHIYNIQVPEHAPPGTVEINAKVILGPGSSLRVPITLDITPAVIAF